MIRSPPSQTSILYIRSGKSSIASLLSIAFKVDKELLGKGLMTLQEIQNQALQLSIGDRWQLVEVLLDSLKREAEPKLKRRNLSRLRGIAKMSADARESNAQADYVTYLTEKYQ